MENCTSKQRVNGNQLIERNLKSSLIDMFPNYSGDSNGQKGLRNICIFCFPCNLRAADCSDVTGGSVGRKEGGERKIVFIVPLVGLLRAIGAAHHCQD